jgi:hypothetical protein
MIGDLISCNSSVFVAGIGLKPRAGRDLLGPKFVAAREPISGSRVWARVQLSLTQEEQRCPGCWHWHILVERNELSSAPALKNGGAQAKSPPRNAAYRPAKPPAIAISSKCGRCRLFS